MGLPEAYSKAARGTLDFGFFWPPKTFFPYSCPPKTTIFITA